MPQSRRCNFAHIVFSTKNRESMIGDGIALRIYSYLTAMVEERDANLLAVNDMPDHLHLLINSSKNMTNAIFMKELKGGTSKWINNNNLVLGHLQWQAGYGWFSVSPKDTDQVIEYIRIQKEHHRRVSFQDEFRKFLKNYQVEYDERYVWD